MLGGRVLFEERTRLATPGAVWWRPRTQVAPSCLQVTLLPSLPVALPAGTSPASPEQCHEYSLLDELQVF